MPRLRELKAQFLRYDRRPDGVFYQKVDTLAEADGILFVCPKCFAEKHSVVGAHSVICWFRGKVPDDATPGPGRWTPAGSGYDDLSFVPGSPPMMRSVQLNGGCQWHGFVQNGEAN